MAERRMFTKKVTDDDNFMQLSSSAQALYLHLTMSADDDGFCNQVSLAMFKAHASVQDLQSLLERRYIYQFENGVIVIKHWRMANALRKDRYTPTAFREELARLQLKENGSYTWLPDGCQMVAERLPQYRLDKDRLEEISLDKDSKDNKTSFYLSDEKISEIMSLYLDKIEPEPYPGHVDFIKASIQSKGADKVMAALKKCVEDGKTSFPRVMGAINGA